jgi:hypothetical protein
MFGIFTGLGLAILAATGAEAATLGAYNVDPNFVSVSGLFKIGFGVFAGGPYDCARNQAVSHHTLP